VHDFAGNERVYSCTIDVDVHSCYTFDDLKLEHIFDEVDSTDEVNKLNPLPWDKLRNCEYYSDIYVNTNLAGKQVSVVFEAYKIAE